MDTQILAGNIATYVGPGIDEKWQLREGVDCVVQSDTCVEAKHIPVVFECENTLVNVLMSKLKFKTHNTRDY